MAILFSSRVGCTVFGKGLEVRYCWPLGRIDLGTESLTLDVLFKQFQIPFSDIERLQMGWMSVRVNHQAPGVPKLITISGWKLPSRLRRVIAEHNLRVEL